MKLLFLGTWEIFKDGVNGVDEVKSEETKSETKTDAN